MRHLRPLKDRIWVERIEKPTKVVLTDADPTKFAKVLAIGPKVYDLKPGDIVALPGIASSQPDWYDKTTMMIQQGDVGFIVNA